MSSADSNRLWRELASFAVDPAHLRAHKIITAGRDDPAYAAFDVLRTRIMPAMKDNGWKRLAITSPTPDCGKTFTAANLAVSLSRYDTYRTILLDMDLRKSSLHKVFGVKNPGSMGDYLRGLVPLGRHFRVPGTNDLNISRNLAVAFNGKREEFASELMQDPLSEEVLEAMEEDLEPDIVLFDLPPVLMNDDVIAFRPQFDAALIVVGGGVTRASELKLVQRHLGEDMPILGMVLNMADGSTLHKSYY